MGCQRGIAKKIMDKKADYIIALKGNQGTLLEDVEVFAIEQKTRGFKDATVSRHETIDMAASKPEPTPPSTMSHGCKSAMIGRA